MAKDWLRHGGRFNGGGEVPAVTRRKDYMEPEKGAPAGPVAKGSIRLRYRHATTPPINSVKEKNSPNPPAALNAASTFSVILPRHGSQSVIFCLPHAVTVPQSTPSVTSSSPQQLKSVSASILVLLGALFQPDLRISFSSSSFTAIAAQETENWMMKMQKRTTM